MDSPRGAGGECVEGYRPAPGTYEIYPAYEGGPLTWVLLILLFALFGAALAGYQFPGSDVLRALAGR